jgi:hypothetical protein
VTRPAATDRPATGRPAGAAPPSIEVEAAAEEAGLGPMLADLIRQNLAQHPDRRGDFEQLRGKVAITAVDAEVTVTLDFFGGGLLVRGGAQGGPDLTISTDSLTLLELTNAQLRMGLPDPASPSGRAVLGKLVSRKLRISGRGLVLKPRLLASLTKLLSVAAG